MEEWKEIPGYEKLYEASTYGNIRTCEGKVTSNSRYETRVWKQRILKQKTDKGGYKRVSLWLDGKNKDYLVHRLVALTFIDKIEEKELINHKDSNPSNNLVENLEWCNHYENLIHAYQNNLNKAAKKTVLTNKSTGEAHFFVSQTAASKFLGKYHGFINEKIKKNVFEHEEYLISFQSQEQGAIE